MTTDPLLWWRNTIGDVAPAGHCMRRFLPRKWVRFHSLPQSKRYAATEAEYAVLLQRHQEVASVLFAEGEQIYVFRSRLHEEDEKPVIAGESLLDGWVSLPANPRDVDPEEDDHYVVRTLVTHWKPPFFERLVRQVADEEESGITFVSPVTRNIYAPYDGGMDVFPFSRQPAWLVGRFRGWLSARADRPEIGKDQWVEGFSSLVTVMVPLVDEGVDVWRPVQAEVLPHGRYQIVTEKSDPDERWAFGTGEVVRCEERELDGESALVAVALADGAA